MRSAKVCMMGSFGVGKTSLVQRFVHQQFDERYLSTLGVKIDTRVADTSAGPVKMVLWDLEGTDPSSADERPLARIRSYTRGAHGLILVADGTRQATVKTALRLYHDFCREYHDTPAVLMVNKADLEAQWQFDESILPDYLKVFQTSALNGQNTEEAFTALGEALYKI